MSPGSSVDPAEGMSIQLRGSGQGEAQGSVFWEYVSSVAQGRAVLGVFKCIYLKTLLSIVSYRCVGIGENELSGVQVRQRV